jgi:uncharacterized paraquat-inducible protein A
MTDYQHSPGRPPHCGECGAQMITVAADPSPVSWCPRCGSVLYRDKGAPHLRRPAWREQAKAPKPEIGR